MGDLGDILGGLFGGAGSGRGRGRRRGAERGADLQVDVTVSFDDSLNGAEVRVPVEKPDGCDTCHGSGAAPGTTPEGVPGVPGPRGGGPQPGLLRAVAALPALSWTGHHHRAALSHLPRHRRAEQGAPLNVKIPAGVKDGTRIKIKGKGEAGQRGGQSGDLYVRRARRARRGVRPPRRRPGARGPRHGGRGGARRVRERPDGRRRPRVAQGAGRKPGRAHVPHPRQGRPASQGRPRRLARATTGAACRDKLNKDQKKLFEQLSRTLPDPRAAAGLSRRAEHWTAKGRGRRCCAMTTGTRPLFMISVAAELAGMHPQTLRMYERRGLLRPQRTAKNTRRYSQRDVERCGVSRSSPSWGSTSPAWSACWRMEEQLRVHGARARDAASPPARRRPRSCAARSSASTAPQVDLVPVPHAQIVHIARRRRRA